MWRGVLGVSSLSTAYMASLFLEALQSTVCGVGDMYVTIGWQNIVQTVVSAGRVVAYQLRKGGKPVVLHQQGNCHWGEVSVRPSLYSPT